MTAPHAQEAAAYRAELQARQTIAAGFPRSPHKPLCPSDDSPLTLCREDTGLTKPGHYWCDTHYHWVSFAAAH